MDNAGVAALLNEIALLLEMKGENVYRIRAYQRAAETVRSLGEPLAALRARGELAKQPGIGRGLAETIEQALDGRPIPLRDELYRSFPPGVVTLTSIPGVGPRLAARAYQELGVASIDELEAAARAGRLAGLPRVGEKTAANILRNIEAMRSRGTRLPIAAAIPIVGAVMEALRQSPHLHNLTPAGSFRRFRETVGDLDLIGTSDQPDEVMDRLASLPYVRAVVAHGPTKTSVVIEPGLQLDLRLVADEDFGSLLQHFTGSQQHNIQLREYAAARGKKVREYGTLDAATGQEHHFAREEDVYAFLELQYIPPEIREGLDEVERAAQHTIPRLIEIGDIRGDLHMHTTASDGHNTLAAMSQDEETMTRRLLAAIENPHVDIIGHPSARIIGQREPVRFDRAAVFAAAARTRTALEVNAHPSRLDLKDSDVRLARAAGCVLTIDTDAHAVAELDLMPYGVRTARRGWAEPSDVMNTRPLDELLAWLNRQFL